MGLWLPNSMLRERRFICTVCGFKYIRKTPSSVDKCPICLREKGIVSQAYERGTNPQTKLDPYSEQKKRWYADPLGRSHIEEIKARKITYDKAGKPTITIVDKHGRKIDEAVNIPVAKERKIARFIKE